MVVPRRIILLFPILVVMISLLFLLRYGYQALNGQKEIAVIRQGVCNQDVKADILYGLKGNVEFYWNRLYTPNDLHRLSPPKDGYLRIPGIWNKTLVNGKPIKGEGYATIRFWLRLPKGKTYGLRMREFDCAYKLWIDGKPRIDCGKVGTTKEATIPSWKRYTQYFYTWNNQTEVVIQIANFHHWKGGPEDCIMLGRAIDVMKQKENASGFSFFILGMFLIMGITHLVVFLYLKEDRSSLVFSIFCILISIRLITTGEKVIYLLFPDMDWLLAVRLEYLSYILAPPTFFIFIRLIFPRLVSRRICNLAVYFSVVTALAVVALPSTLFSYIPLFHLWSILLMGAYCQVLITIALWRRYAYSVVMFLGYTFFFIVTVNDLSYHAKLVDTAYLIPLGVFVLIIAQAFVISKKNSLAFRDVERLHDELELYNRELEDRIEERTKEISARKQELEAKANELRLVNEKLVKLDRLRNALTAMVVHDLKNPLNMVLNYANDARITSAGHQMLGLVQNILDIQKYENDKMVLNRHRIPIETVIDKSIESVTYFAAQHNISIINRIPSSIELNVDADVVERIFTNLLTNALKYTPMNSEVMLEFRVLEQEQALFSITDKGPGIPMDKQELIFEKYGSYNEQMLGRVKPTGLGLAFCKMAVEAHGGTIGYSSRLGEGTRMWFTLPIGVNSKIPDQSAIELLEENLPPNMAVHLVFQNEEEEQTFRMVVEALLEVEVYKASRIRKVLNEGMPKGNPSVSEWIEMLLSAVWSGNEQRYKQLLLVALRFTASERGKQPNPLSKQAEA